MEITKETTRHLARKYAEQGKPDKWFEEFYARAEGDVNNIYWADLHPNPLLLTWIRSQKTLKENKAITVGCGVGDDAEAIAKHGYNVTAFDISPSAIDMCRQRYPESTVNYQVADLFKPPPAWLKAFDLVYECNTIQILTGVNRKKAIRAIAHLVAPGGYLLVSCRSGRKEDAVDSFPVPLDRYEINGFVRAGLQEISFVSYDDDQQPPVPHYFAVYRCLSIRPE